LGDPRQHGEDLHDECQRLTCLASADGGTEDGSLQTGQAALPRGSGCLDGWIRERMGNPLPARLLAHGDPDVHRAAIIPGLRAAPTPAAAGPTISGGNDPAGRGCAPPNGRPAPSSETPVGSVEAAMLPAEAEVVRAAEG